MTAAYSRRLVWLDALRLLCALQIVGFHWLRASAANGLFGSRDQVSLVSPYRNLTSGIAELHYLAVDQSGISTVTLLNDIFGLIFGFGWEAVNVFILLSGLTLALNFRRDDGHVLAWYIRRVRRILLPFYCVAVPTLLAAYVFYAFANGRIGVLGRLATKIGPMIPDTLPVALAKHLLLLDPSHRHWVAYFFSPAWWFVPSIIVAYLIFPLLFRISERFGPTILLIGSFCVTIASYALSEHGILVEDAWYFVILHELFAFVVGIEIGTWIQVDELADPQITRIAAHPVSLLVGLLLFALGNVANWFFTSYPISSPLYTLGLILVLAFFAVHLARWRPAATVAKSIDTYHVYLLHQPLAFPLAILFSLATGRLAVFLGGTIYLLIALSIGLFTRRTFR